MPEIYGRPVPERTTPSSKLERIDKIIDSIDAVLEDEAESRPGYAAKDPIEVFPRVPLRRTRRRNHRRPRSEEK
jgi:hypothetical protein